MGTKSRWDSEKTKPSRFHFTSSNSSSNFSGNESVTVQRRFFVSLMRSTTPCVVIAKAPTERPKIAQGIAAWDLGPPVSNRPGAIHPPSWDRRFPTGQVQFIPVLGSPSCTRLSSIQAGWKPAVPGLRPCSLLTTLGAQIFPRPQRYG